MVVKRIVKAQITEAQVAEYEAQIGGGGGLAYGFKPGFTAFFPIVDTEQLPLFSFPGTKSVYNGNTSERVVFYALIWEVREVAKALPDVHKTQFIPIYIPRSLAKSILRAGLPTKSFGGEETRGGYFSEQNENGEMAYGDLFVVHRVGSGMNDTEYTVTVDVGMPDSYFEDLPETLPVPEKDIRQLAEDNSISQLAKLDNAPVNKPEATPEKEVTGFR